MLSIARRNLGLRDVYWRIGSVENKIQNADVNLFETLESVPDEEAIKDLSPNKIYLIKLESDVNPYAEFRVVDGKLEPMGGVLDSELDPLWTADKPLIEKDIETLMSYHEGDWDVL